MKPTRKINLKYLIIIPCNNFGSMEAGTSCDDRKEDYISILYIL